MNINPGKFQERPYRLYLSGTAAAFGTRGATRLTCVYAATIALIYIALNVENASSAIHDALVLFALSFGFAISPAVLIGNLTGRFIGSQFERRSGLTKRQAIGIGTQVCLIGMLLTNLVGGFLLYVVPKSIEIPFLTTFWHLIMFGLPSVLYLGAGIWLSGRFYDEHYPATT